MDIEELVERFEIFDDWADKYRYIIELGRELPPLDERFKTEANRVEGCVSNVWLVAEPDADDPSRVRFQADSDAHIVKGLVLLVLTMFSGKTPAEIEALDAKPVFAELGLQAHLSPSRSNGLYAMVRDIKLLAKQHG